MSTAAQVLEAVHHAIHDDRVAVGRDDGMRVGVLRVGEQAHMFLSAAAGWRAAHGRPLTVLFGVPIDPDGTGCNWSLLNRAGTVIAHGEIDGP